MPYVIVVTGLLEALWWWEGGWVRMLTAMVSWRQKIKRKHCLKHPLKQSPKKQNLDRNKDDSKSDIWNYFIENIISGIQLFYINPHVSANIIKVFFLISDFLEESLQANKNYW